MVNQAPLHPSPRDYNNHRTRVKRVLALALVLTACGVLALWLNYRNRSVTVHPAISLPHNVNRQLSGYTFTRSEEGHRIFTIHAARTLAFKQGTSTLLKDVSVVIFGRSGNQHDELRTGRCRYNNETGALACSGVASLKLESKPGLQATPDLPSGHPVFVQMADVSYDPLDGAVKSPAEVSFSFGGASGTARGLAYDTKTGSLSLEKQVHVRLPAQSASQPSIDVHAGGLLYEKAVGEILLRGPVDISRGLQRVSASDGTIFLGSQNRINRVSLEGHMRGSSPSRKGHVRVAAQALEIYFDPVNAQPREVRALGHVYLQSRGIRQDGVRSLSANRVRLNVSGDKAQLRSGSASGNVQLVFEPMEAASRSVGSNHNLGAMTGAKRILTTAELQFSVRAGGALRDARTDGPGKVVLIPARPQADEQSISAKELRMAFDTQGRLQRLVGLISTHVTDSPPTNANPGLLKETFGRKLIASINPRTQTLETIRQEGDFRFKEGDRGASAMEALFQAQNQELTLIGSPQMWDTGNRIRARHVTMNLAQGSALGWGQVQSVHLASDTSVEPLIVAADKVTVSKDKQEALYEGNVRAWQGAGVVSCSSLSIDRRSQEIRSGYGVTTTLLQPGPAQSNHRTGQANHPAQPVTIRADRLIYFNLDREAVYQGGVIMRSRGATLRADRLRVYLSSASGRMKPEVERAVADGHIRVFQPGGRQAQGEHAEYSAAGGRFVLTGGPPIIYDPNQGFLTGDRLTFYLHDASLSADGGKKSQTLSKRILQR
ncbi:MAG: LptA/OstA family protein [Terriglobia bacterium]